MKKQKAYNTRYSQAVTHPSTNRARRRLTSVIGRERVFSTWYGRRHESGVVQPTLWLIKTSITKIHNITAWRYMYHVTLAECGLEKNV